MPYDKRRLADDEQQIVNSIKKDGFIRIKRQSGVYRKAGYKRKGKKYIFTGTKQITPRVQDSIIAGKISFLRSLLLVFALGLTYCLHAQLCTGSLGDPVVNINFSSGGNTAYTPTNAYTYTYSSCPDDGFYTITNSTSDCFGGTWLTVNADHTTGHGEFMLVNASFEPGDFFVAKVTNLCPNTNYQFSAWIMNVLTRRSGIRPNITFTIEAPDSTVLQSYSTGDIPQAGVPEWGQYGFYFTTPADNPVIVLRMRNNAPGGIGNDLALDDITFRPCGPIIISSVQGNSDTVNICEGNTNLYTFNADASSAYTDPVYQWQVSVDTGFTWKDITGATTNSYLRLPTGEGLYWYRVAVTERSSASIISCRIESNAVVIHVHPKPTVNAGADRILIINDSIHLDGKVTGESPDYYWGPPDYLSDIKRADPVASPTTDMDYTLFSKSAFGCKNEDDMHVKVVKGIFVPSAFTPNGDGKNDRWRIPYLDPLLGATVNVYNRFGKLVYRAAGTSVDWDGTLHGEPQPPAVYIYLIQFPKGRADMKGTVTLIR